MPPGTETKGRGAYGLRLTGLEAVGDLLVSAPSDWPEVAVEFARGPTTGARERVEPDRATVVFRDAVAEIRRDPAAIAFTFAQDPTVAGILHPYLSPAAGLIAHWNSRECIHAGAFVHAGGAWGLVADRGGGKSTTLARLALDGVPVLADDLLVLDATCAFAGPRAIDLRAEPARRLGVGEPLGVLGTRERWRLGIPDVEPAVPFRGWVFLEWGDSVSAMELSPQSRLERLARQRMIRLLPSEPLALLKLASLSAVEVRRPHGWDSLPETTRLLLESLPA